MPNPSQRAGRATAFSDLSAHRLIEMAAAHDQLFNEILNGGRHRSIVYTVIKRCELFEQLSTIQDGTADFALLGKEKDKDGEVNTTLSQLPSPVCSIADATKSLRIASEATLRLSSHITEGLPSIGDSEKAISTVIKTWDWYQASRVACRNATNLPAPANENTAFTEFDQAFCKYIINTETLGKNLVEWYTKAKKDEISPFEASYIFQSVQSIVNSHQMLLTQVQENSPGPLLTQLSLDWLKNIVEESNPNPLTS